jgi:hypothetical protein
LVRGRIEELRSDPPIGAKDITSDEPQVRAFTQYLIKNWTTGQRFQYKTEASMEKGGIGS